MKYIKGKLNLVIFFKTIFTWTLVGIMLAIEYIFFIPPLIIWTLIFDRRHKKPILWITRFFVRLFFFLYVTSNFTIDLNKIKKAKGPRIYILNHASQFDTFLMYLLPGRIQVFVKEEYSKVPFIGWTIRLSGNILVKKPGDANEEYSVYDEGVKELNDGATILIFPEGTKSKDGNIGRFKIGGFKLAYETKSEIVPVVIDSWDAIRPKNGGWIRDDRMWMRVLDPLKYEDYKNIDVRDFTKLMRIKMADELLKIRDKRRSTQDNYYRHDEIFVNLDNESRNKLKEFKQNHEMLI